MAKPFDLRKQLKLPTTPCCANSSSGNPEMLAVPWDSLRPHEVEPIVAILGKNADDHRRQAQVVLQDVHELSDERGQRVLTEEIQWRDPDSMPIFSALKSRADKALWACLYARLAFDEAAIFARADTYHTASLPTAGTACRRSRLR